MSSVQVVVEAFLVDRSTPRGLFRLRAALSCLVDEVATRVRRGSLVYTLKMSAPAADNLVTHHTRCSLCLPP